MFLALQWFAFTYTWTFDCVLTHNIVVETGQLEIYSTGSFFPYWTLQNMNVQLLSLTWKPKPTVTGNHSYHRSLLFHVISYKLLGTWSRSFSRICAEEDDHRGLAKSGTLFVIFFNKKFCSTEWL